MDSRHDTGAPVPRVRLLQGEVIALQLAARGYSMAQIAAVRKLKEHDVAATLVRAAAELGVTTIAEAIAEARRRGLIL